MKLVRSSKNKTQILCHLVRREPAWIIAEPDMSHLSKWSFSNLLLCSIISACPRVCEKHSHSLGFAITAGTEAALSPRSRSPSVCHWGVLWTFQMVYLFIYLFNIIYEREWAGVDRQYHMCHFGFAFQDFLSPQGRMTFSSLKMKEYQMIFFIWYVIYLILSLDNKC